MSVDKVEVREEELEAFMGNPLKGKKLKAPPLRYPVIEHCASSSHTTDPTRSPVL